MSVEIKNRRILVVDDNVAIHDDFRKILAPRAQNDPLHAMESSLFGGESSPRGPQGFELEFATQGQGAALKMKQAVAEGRPFAVAFVDVRMPPGWDGVETTTRLWEIDPRLQVVICSAHSDYSWDDLHARLPTPQQLLILRKPFDSVEVLQLAHSLTEKWELLLASQRRQEELERAVAARTAALERAHAELLAQIASREELESRLRHAQQLEALGRLAGGIAHEINNPLSFVLTNLHYLAEVVGDLQPRPPMIDELRQATSEAVMGAERIRRIVRDVRVFAQAEDAPLAEVSVRSAVDRAIEMAQPFLEGRSRVTVSIGELPDVVASNEGLRQVLSNLLVNAAQAMPEGRQALNEIRVSGSTDERGRVRIAVADNGCGITRENLTRIFEPFFTTRPIGSGTGLGLCICYGVVHRMGGEISVVSTPEIGSVFTVTLDAGKSRTLPAPPEPPVAAPETAAGP